MMVSTPTMQPLFLEESVSYLQEIFPSEILQTLCRFIDSTLMFLIILRVMDSTMIVRSIPFEETKWAGTTGNEFFINIIKEARYLKYRIGTQKIYTLDPNLQLI